MPRPNAFPENPVPPCPDDIFASLGIPADLLRADKPEGSYEQARRGEFTSLTLLFNQYCREARDARIARMLDAPALLPVPDRET